MNGAQAGYRPFPNVEARNTLQRTVEVPLFARALDLPVGGRVLEVGCGKGTALAPIARACAPARLTGLDIDQVLVEEARLETRTIDTPPIDVVVADIRAMPFPNGSFDLIIDFGTCYHIAGTDLALREVSRVLSAGGIFATENPIAQAFAHPMRCTGRGLPWESAPRLVLRKDALWWSSWEKRS